jgi:aminoglycoside phosphotransferase family enzyme
MSSENHVPPKRILVDKIESGQEDLILSLKKENAYPHHVSRIRIIETHISWIILTGQVAYKIKKAVKFGDVLDFSTLELRRRFCLREVTLNRRLCSKMYQGVTKIVKNDSGYKVVNSDEVGRPLEYAVKMLEFPQKYRLDNLLKSNKINSRVVDLLIDKLVKFHKAANTNSAISRYGRPQKMKEKIKENFRSLSKLSKTDPVFEKKLNMFIKNNPKLFYERIRLSRIRDIHGDLYLKNIFYVKKKFYIYDRIEFNDFLRYADIVEDVAHLAMDFHFNGRVDIQSYLIRNYINKSNDTTIINIIYFMMCYKACVRAKVSFFRAAQLTNRKMKSAYANEGKEHLKLARSYMKHF